MLEEAINSLPGDLRSRVGDALRQRVLSQCDQAFSDAKSTGASNNSKSYRHMDGLGEMRGSIPATAYQLWEQREPGCWGDKKFVKKYLQDNPEVRVNTRSDKIQVGYRGNGFIPVGAGRRVKVYK